MEVSLDGLMCSVVCRKDHYWDRYYFWYSYMIYQNGLKTVWWLMFANDTKIRARIQKLEDKDSLQYDLDKLVEWSKNG